MTPGRSGCNLKRQFSFLFTYWYLQITLSFEGCLTAPIHYLIHCWSTPMSPYVVTRPQWVNDSIIQCMQQWFPRHQLQLPQLVNGACYPSDHPETTTMCTWSRHQMETFSASLAICAGNSPVTGEFSAQRPVTRSFDVFFDLRLNKRLSKQQWG